MKAVRKIKRVVFILILISMLALVSCSFEGCEYLGDIIPDNTPDNPSSGDTEHVHTEVIDPEVPATCTSTGLTEGKHCSECGEIIVAQQEIPVKPHTVVIDVAVNATCSNTGLTEGKHCSECGEIFVAQQETPVKPHTVVVDAAITSTCTSTGLTEGKHCSDCGEIFIAQQTIPILTHRYDDKNDAHCNDCEHVRDTTCVHIEIVIIAGKNSTCSAIGYTDGEKCEDCGELLVAQEALPVLTHKYNDTHDEICNECNHERDVTCVHIHVEIIIGVDSTCSNIGYTDGEKCEDCGELLVAQQTIPRKTHRYDDKKDKDCNDCEHERNADCTHAHKEIITGKDATCTQHGYTDGVRCKDCGELLIGQKIIPIKSHTYDDDNDAYCNECGLARNIECNHGMTITIKGYPATCISTGYTDGTKCKNCGKILVEQMELPITDHSESDWIVDRQASDGAEGLRHKECIVCGEQLTEEYFGASIGLKYELNDDGQSYSVIGKGSCTDFDIVIPGFYNNLPVTEIGDNAFNRCTSLTSIKIPDSVTSIGAYAFYYCSKLTSIKIPDSVTSIGAYAFYYCSKLTSIEIPNSVTSIGRATFYYCNSLESIEIPNSVISIEKEAFYNCRSLKNIVIPDSVTSVGNDAFSYCYSLESVTIGSSVKNLGDHAFYNCSRLSSITIGNPLMTMTGNNAFTGCYPKDIYYNGDIEEWVTYRRLNVYSTFSNGINLYFKGELVTEVIIPETIASIDYRTFYQCISLERVILSDSVTIIGQEAFAGCTSLESVVMSDFVTTISYSAFQDCTSLTSIEIPDSITFMDYAAFSGCTSLKYNEYENAEYLGNSNNPYLVLVRAKNKSTITSFTTHSDTKLIVQSAFSGCGSLIDVVIGDSVISIGTRAFAGCDSLTHVVIGDSLISIGKEAFYGCDGLRDGDGITFKGTVEQWKAITKGEQWHGADYGDYVVRIYCSDGSFVQVF